MPASSLPDDPDMGQLRRQAKELRRAVLAGEPDAVAAVAELHPRGSAAVVSFPLSAAQLVVARRHGFASWPKLKQHVELVNRLTRAPEALTTRQDPSDEFLRLACLNYGDDSVERRTRAAALLAAEPAAGAASIHAAAATAAVDAVRSFLAADPASATRDGGPYDWVPLMYLAYARHDPSISAAAVLATAHALLDAGADPNSGYLWHGLPSAFTVLTGVFGEGEQGPRDQPRHPHSRALARLLLKAGADANDSQTLYNRMFEPDNDHLELLFEFGLGTGDGGPWRARLGNTTMSPAEMVGDQLWWAVEHDMVERVQVLVANGADPAASLRRGRTAVESAAIAGNMRIVELLVGGGAAPPTLAPVQQLLGALSAGDRVGVSTLMAADPLLLGAAQRARPSLLVDAVAADRLPAVELLLELGFDVNAYGRGDAPRNGTWETPLHVAADRGRLAIARHLLGHGADPSLHDRRFDATPLGWARHADHAALVELLEPITPELLTPER